MKTRPIVDAMAGGGEFGHLLNFSAPISTLGSSAWPITMDCRDGQMVTSDQPVVEGMVTDAAGLTIAGALVRLRQHGIDYSTLADDTGGYQIAMPGGEPLATGIWPITCGHVVRNISIESHPTRANISGVAPESAYGRSFDRAHQRKQRCRRSLTPST